MASVLYPLGKEAPLGGDINWDADDIVAIAVSAPYTYNSAHQFAQNGGDVDVNWNASGLFAL